MIRITQIGEGSKWHLFVEGTLSDGCVDALETSWLEAHSHHGGNSICIDLSGVTYIDENGRDLLTRIMRDGAELRAMGIMNRAVVGEIVKETENKRIN